MSEESTQIPADSPAAPAYAASGSTSASAPAQDKPELVVAGAFAGAFLFAKILRRIGGS